MWMQMLLQRKPWNMKSKKRLNNLFQQRFCIFNARNKHALGAGITSIFAKYWCFLDSYAHLLLVHKYVWLRVFNQWSANVYEEYITFGIRKHGMVCYMLTLSDMTTTAQRFMFERFIYCFRCLRIAFAARIHYAVRISKKMMSETFGFYIKK